MTELELLSTVECLKEFKRLIWGQYLKVFTDHKNLTHDVLGLPCNRVYRWRLPLEDYGPDIVYLEGYNNVVADAMSCLKYHNTIHTEYVNVDQNSSVVAIILCSYTEGSDNYLFQTDNMYVQSTHISDSNII